MTSGNEKRILIVEDDLTLSRMLKTWLGKNGFVVDTVSRVSDACRLLEKHGFDIILSDMRLPDKDGTFLLSWMNKARVSAPVIIMTRYADIGNAVEAMKRGACDYISKPMPPDLLIQKINEALEKYPVEAQKERSAEAKKDRMTRPAEQKKDASEPVPADGNASADHIEGDSEAAKQLYNYVRLVAPTPMSVLINGASGTGKEYVAHRIHLQSQRAGKPFVAIDCGAIPNELAASEFFGHVKGSFTGALADKTGAFVAADGGTLFLDEVGNLDYSVQVQLLRAIQERRIRPVGSNKEIAVDVRLVCATNENLQAAIAEGRFREDLFHRINEFTLKMPSLRERGNDILLFANFFLNKANRELNHHVKGFSVEAEKALLAYSWPGNLRQLKNCVTRAVLLAQGEVITPAELDSEILNAVTPEPSPSFALYDVSDERARIEKALRQTNNNKSKAAALLGIDRKTLYNKLKNFGF